MNHEHFPARILLAVVLLTGIALAQDTTFTVTANGNVGIGITNPLEKLHVEGSLYLNSAVGALRIRNSGTGDGWRIGTIGGGRNLTFIDDPAGGGTNRVTFVQGGNLGIGTTNPGQRLEVVGNIAVSGTVDGVDVSQLKADYDSRRSRYFRFTGLGDFGPVTVTSSGTRLNTTSSTHTFNKLHEDTIIEVYVNSRFSIGTLSGGAFGVRFQVRVDTRTPNFENAGSIRSSNTAEFLSIFAVFENVPAGSHTVSLWGFAPVPGGQGSATNVLVDPGGWGGAIIVKETR